MIRTYVPCGACRSLVPADSGCDHWHPKVSAKTQRERSRRRERQEAVLKAQELARQMRGGR